MTQPIFVPIPKVVRDLLVCPSCRGELRDVPNGLVCDAEELLYPVVDGVPHLVRELARRHHNERSS